MLNNMKYSSDIKTLNLNQNYCEHQSSEFCPKSIQSHQGHKTVNKSGRGWTLVFQKKAEKDQKQ